jgi:beta-galactosidase
MVELEFRGGVAHLDGKPEFLLTADYPYYRDDPKLWRLKLERLASLGVKAITAYVPWRHHEIELDGERRFDFVGETRANRNVVGFVDVCRQVGLPLIVKPGPFCHAELNYGGLPDFVCPLFRADIDHRLSGDGNQTNWSGAALSGDGSVALWPLPSAFSAVFQMEAERWLHRVAADVLHPALAPNGPIVAVQVGNEGLFSDAQHAVWAHDFSHPALEAFRAWLRASHTSLEEYNLQRGTQWREWDAVEPPQKWTLPQDLRSLDRYREWSEFLGVALSDLLSGYARQLDLSVPAITNVNPPRAEPWGLDAWFSRVRPSLWQGLQFGFTNWIGVAADDESVAARYAIAASWGRGPNLEDNWGFTEYYGPAYEHPVVSFHQSLSLIGVGASGLNLYTGVGTADWDASLDLLHTPPYPSSAPVDAAGRATAKAGVAALLCKFLDEFGRELLECAVEPELAWGVVPSDSNLGAWIAGSEATAVDGRVLAAPGPMLAHVQKTANQLGHELSLVDLSSVDSESLGAFSAVLVAGMPSMPVEIQEVLAAYVNAGGRLVMIGEVPDMDSELRACRVLQEAGPLRIRDLSDLDSMLAGLLRDRGGVHVSAGGRAWLLRNPSRDIQHLVLVSSGSNDLEISFRAGRSVRNVRVRLAGGGGAIVRLEAGAVTSLLVKGIDERFDRSVVPSCSMDGFELAALEQCDLLAVRTEQGWCVCGPATAEEAETGVYLASHARFTVRESS